MKEATLLFAVSMTATRATRQTLEIPNAFGDSKVLQIADVTYHASKANFVVAGSYEEAGKMAMSLAKEIFPVSDNWHDHRVHVLALKDVVNLPGDYDV